MADLQTIIVGHKKGIVIGLSESFGTAIVTEIMGHINQLNKSAVI